MIRAITFSTLSRFTKFISIDNQNFDKEILFKNYLTLILKKFSDEEQIVQEAACDAFSNLILQKQENLKEYVPDIIQLIINIIDNYKSNNLLSLYETIILLTDFYEDDFKLCNLVDILISKIMLKFSDYLKLFQNKEFSATCVFVSSLDIICSLLRAVPKNMEGYFNNLLIFSFQILESEIKKIKIEEMNLHLISKIIDLISCMFQFSPDFVKKSNLINDNIYMLILRFLDLNNNNLTQYIIALIGDFIKITPDIFMIKREEILITLLKYLNIPENISKDDKEYVSITNNSCWTLGIIFIQCKESLNEMIINEIIRKLSKFYNYPKVLFLNLIV